MPQRIVVGMSRARLKSPAREIILRELKRLARADQEALKDETLEDLDIDHEPVIGISVDGRVTLSDYDPDHESVQVELSLDSGDGEEMVFDVVLEERSFRESRRKKSLSEIEEDQEPDKVFLHATPTDLDELDRKHRGRVVRGYRPLTVIFDRWKQQRQRRMMN